MRDNGQHGSKANGAGSAIARRSVHAPCSVNASSRLAGLVSRQEKFWQRETDFTYSFAPYQRERGRQGVGVFGGSKALPMTTGPSGSRRILLHFSRTGIGVSSLRQTMSVPALSKAASSVSPVTPLMNAIWVKELAPPSSSTARKLSVPSSVIWTKSVMTSVMGS